MKTIWIMIINLSLFANILPQSKAIIQEVINTEFSFAKRSTEVGTTKAFLEFIANDGILFRPGPVNGKEALAKAKEGVKELLWYPQIVVVSKSQDLAFSTGPWIYKGDKNDSTKDSYGDFATIWEKQKDGSWKFAIDIGHDNKKPLKKSEPLSNVKVEQNSIIENILGDKSKIILFDKENCKMDNIPSLYKDASHFMINNEYRLDGREAIANYLNNNLDSCVYTVIDGKISFAEDLGYTYGVLKGNSKIEMLNKEFYYVRMWHKQNNRWYILCEIWNLKADVK